MKNNWKYQHIIDLEYFFHQDLSKTPDELHERDRSFYLEQPQYQGPDNTIKKRNALIRLWLDRRNSIEFSKDSQRSPGKIFRDALLLAKNLFAFKGLLLGVVAGLTFFTYTGTTPVNVFHFLLLFILPQIVLAILLVVFTILHFISPNTPIPSFYSSIIRKLVNRLITFVHKKWLQSLHADKKESIRAAFGILKTQNKVYGSLFYWPFFSLAQLFGIGFNAGLLLVTLLKVMTNDLAFGWQSTVQFSSAAILHFVQYLALPWSWLISQTAGGYPSLVEIEGSRIILKEGIYHLTTTNLIAWWPFLVLCLFTYGFLFRATLFLLGTILEKKAFNGLRFDTPACLSLLRRMEIPLLSTQASKELPKEKEHLNTGQQPPGTPSTPYQLSPQVTLIPDDIFDHCEPEELAHIMHKKGLIVKELHRFMSDYDTDRELVRVLQEYDWSTDEGLLILMEGWMVPLRDFLTLLGEFRSLLPENNIIHLGLIGRPQSTIFTPVQQSDLAVWQHKISSLGDPYLTVFPLIPQ